MEHHVELHFCLPNLGKSLKEKCIVDTARMCVPIKTDVVPRQFKLNSSALMLSTGVAMPDDLKTC